MWPLKINFPSSCSLIQASWQKQKSSMHNLSWWTIILHLLYHASLRISWFPFTRWIFSEGKSSRHLWKRSSSLLERLCDRSPTTISLSALKKRTDDRRRCRSSVYTRCDTGMPDLRKWPVFPICMSLTIRAFSSSQKIQRCELSQKWFSSMICGRGYCTVQVYLSLFENSICNRKL